MDKYYGTFALSYKDYCENNGLKEPPVDMIEQWVGQTIHNYERELPMDMVMSLFEIPENQKKAIEYHEYEIEEEDHELNEEKQFIVIRMILTITR